LASISRIRPNGLRLSDRTLSLLPPSPPPVLLLQLGPEIRESCAEARFDGFIAKPADREVDSLISNCLSISMSEFVFFFPAPPSGSRSLPRYISFIDLSGKPMRLCPFHPLNRPRAGSPVGARPPCLLCRPGQNREPGRRPLLKLPWPCLQRAARPEIGALRQTGQSVPTVMHCELGSGKLLMKCSGLCC
jgi:hypothetical protein